MYKMLDQSGAHKSCFYYPYYRQIIRETIYTTYNAERKQHNVISKFKPLNYNLSDYLALWFILNKY